MKSLQVRLDERADKALKERISKALSPFASMWGNCLDIPYSIREKGFAEMEKMKTEIFNEMQHKNRDEESAKFLATVKEVKEQLDSLEQ